MAVSQTGIKLNTVFYRCRRCKVGCASAKWMEAGAKAYAWSRSIPIIPGGAVPDDAFVLEPEQCRS